MDKIKIYVVRQETGAPEDFWPNGYFFQECNAQHKMREMITKDGYHPSELFIDEVEMDDHHENMGGSESIPNTIFSIGQNSAEFSTEKMY